MHELSIARSILETVQREQASRQWPVVTEVGVQLGALSGVLPEALQFSFDALVTDTPLAGCRLTIERVPAQGQCRRCAQVFTVERLCFACPACASGDVRLRHGYELDIAYLKVEEEAPDP